MKMENSQVEMFNYMSNNDRTLVVNLSSGRVC